LSLGYGFQSLKPQTLIGTKKGTTVTGNLLTSAVGGAGNTTTFSTSTMSKVNFSFNYQLGTSETTNILNVVLSTSADGVNYYQSLNNAVSAGVTTITQATYEFTGATATAPYTFSMPIDVADLWMQIQVYESGVSTNYGTCYCEVTVSGTNK
jgi:hypothetical protein